METKILVAYGSKHGGTQEIAAKISEVLQSTGLQTELANVKDVKDLSPYGAVVLGAGVYIGSWVKEAAKFLKQNAETLKTKKVWLYSSGPTGEGNTYDLLQGWKFPKNLQESADVIQPVEITAFQGVLVPEKMNGFERWIIKNVNAPMGDFRNWEEIAVWAGTIAGTLKAA